MPFSQEEERALIAKAVQGDELAQNRLVRELHPRIYSTACYFMGPGDAEVEDCVQEAFLRAFKGLAGFKGQSSFYTWLNQICVNICFDRLEARRRRLESQTDDLEALSGPASQAQHREGEAKEQADGRLQDLRAALESLPEPCRSLVRRHHLEGAPCASLAREARVPLGTILARLWRCREALKRKLLHKEGS